MTAPIRPGLESRPVAPRLADKGRASRAESSGAGALSRAPQVNKAGLAVKLFERLKALKAAKGKA